MRRFCGPACGWLVTLSLALVTLAQLPLPQVDLGYEIHEAISYNSSGQTYNFSNIRFAQAPVGDLRFAAPVAPIGRNPEVQNGSVDRICPQAYPVWYDIVIEFVTSYLSDEPFDYNTVAATIEANNPKPPPQDSRSSEDCLFLDVIVPEAVFDAAQDPGSKKARAAVLVWIFGGGYIAVSKLRGTNPSGLIEASQANGGEGIVYVALNYRLGAFGWLGGPILDASNGTSNAGLYDQRLAIEWVKKYIHLFGGDPERITIMGESAGGSSVMHQITAYGGEQPVPFAQAILQSPWELPIITPAEQDSITQTFLDILGVQTVEEARQLPSETLIAANALQVFRAPYDNYIYGPVVDGAFVPDTPGKLLLEGRFAKDLKVMVGHNADEGLIYTDPRAQNDTTLTTLLQSLLPSLNDSTIAYIVDTLYPAIYNGSYSYTTGLERTSLLIAELIITCNTNYVDRAFGNQTYAYLFSVAPALHADDIAYTFYNGDGTSPSASVPYPDVALILQQYLINFVQTGDPSGTGVRYFPVYGDGASIQNLNVTGAVPVWDETDNPRCRWWQEALHA